MKIKVLFQGGSRGWLTTEHSASSYGQPVAVINGQAYGPADLIPCNGDNPRYKGLRGQFTTPYIITDDSPETHAWNASLPAEEMPPDDLITRTLCGEKEARNG